MKRLQFLILILFPFLSLSLVAQSNNERSVVPPRLLLPAIGDELAPSSPPVFLWVTIPASSAPAEYRLRIVPVTPGQSDADAIEHNRPVLERTVNDPLYRYSSGDPALADISSAVRFAWRVQSIGDAATGSIQSSEIRSFTVAHAPLADHDCDAARRELLDGMERCNAKNCKAAQADLDATESALEEARNQFTEARAAVVAARTALDDMRRNQEDRRTRTEQMRKQAAELRAELKDHMQTLLDRIVGGKEIVFVEEQPKKRMGSVTLGEIKIYFEGTGPRIQTDEGFQPFSYALGKVRDDAEYQRLDASLTETTRQLAELETGAPAAAQSLTHAEEAIPTAEKEVERSEESLEKAEQNHTEASKRMATCAREKDELCSSLVEIASRHDECAALLARRREVRRELAAAQQAIDSIAAVTPSADSLVADAEQRIRRGEAWEVRSDEARSALERAHASAAEASTALRTGRENLKGAESELTSGNLDAAHRMIEAGKVAAQPAPAIVVRTHNEIAQARTAQETSEEKAAGAVREWVEKETAWNRLYAAMADKLRSTDVSIRGIAQAGALVDEVNNLLGVIGSDILTVVQSRTIPMPTQIEEVTQSVQKRLGSTADALEQLAGEVSEFSAYTPRLRDAAAQLTATQSSGKGNDRIERLASVIPAIRQLLTDLHQSNALVNIVIPGLSSLGTNYTADLDSIRSRFGDEYAAVTESSINARGCSDLVTLGGTTDPCTNRLKRVEQQIDIRKNARGHAFRDDFCAILSIREIQCMVEELRGK